MLGFTGLMRRFALLMVFFLGVGLAAEPNSITVIGSNKDLSDGATALQFGDFEEGVRLTRRGLRFEATPRDRASGLSNLCAGYTALTQFVEAVESCSMAIEIDDGNWHAFNNRALAYLGQGDIDAAKRDLQDGLRLKPDSGKLRQVSELIVVKESTPPVALDN